MAAAVSAEVRFEKRGKVALITFDREKQLNALTTAHYFELAVLMNKIAKMDDVFVTVITGKGRYFSAGADVSAAGAHNGDTEYYVRGFVAQNIYLTHAFYSHPKILVIALNGPAVGLSAAITGFADFVYTVPHAFLLTPFTSLGLVSEGNASIGFVTRLGIAKANEALIMSKRITAEELLQTGYANKVFEFGKQDSAKFLEAVLKEVDDRLGEHLNQESMLRIKAMIQAPYRAKLDAQGVTEVIGGLDRFANGIPQKEFRRMAAKEKKHKL